MNLGLQICNERASGSRLEINWFQFDLHCFFCIKKFGFFRVIQEESGRKRKEYASGTKREQVTVDSKAFPGQKWKNRKEKIFSAEIKLAFLIFCDLLLG